ncbi:hypothetical protein [Cellulomonas sp.]|uniref:hypothetical protein n=1 Tax=Cellulomonas sp. TaxID=40001 RepID=UPI001B12A2DD|nr:hypothetical protein [Cellulomonas sp.]MBO9556023.1 hypothetical protein [Cellulomonas sp.]
MRLDLPGGRHAAVRRAAGVLGTLVVMALAGCSAAPDGDTPSASAAPVTAAPGSPGDVALRYMVDVARGDFTSAAQYVLPGEEGMVQALALGDGTGVTPRVWGDVALGTVESSGDSATVTFVGRLCRSASGAPGDSPPDAECIEEHDEKSSSPYFLLHLARTPSAEWRVTFYPSEQEE